MNALDVQEVLATVEPLVDRRLRHLGVPTQVPPTRPARAPPPAAEDSTDAVGDADVADSTPCC